MATFLKQLLNRKDEGFVVPTLRTFLYANDISVYKGSNKHELSAEMMRYMIELQQGIVKQYDKPDSARDRTKGWYHPSQMAGCLRGVWFGILNATRNAPTVAEESLRRQLIFSTGDMIHLMLQTLTHLSGLLLQAEVPVMNEEHKIIGHTDGIMQFKGEKYLLEIKSINDHGFRALGDGPKPDHLEQINMYMYCTGIPRAVVLYYGKDRQDLREFVIKQDDALVNNILDRVAVVEKHLIDGTVPPKEGQSASSAECRWCGYTQVCHSSAKFDTFIDSLKGRKHESKTKKTIRVKRPKVSFNKSSGRRIGKARSGPVSGASVRKNPRFAKVTR